MSRASKSLPFSSFVFTAQVVSLAWLTPACGDSKTDGVAGGSTSIGSQTTTAGPAAVPGATTNAGPTTTPVGGTTSAPATPTPPTSGPATSAPATSAPMGTPTSTSPGVATEDASSATTPSESSGGNVDPGPSSGNQVSDGEETQGPSPAAMPSPGCNGGNGDATVPSAVVDKPTGYDGSTPVPVLFAFHGAGGNSSSLQGPFASDAKARGYLGVYLKSSGSAWDVRADTPVLDAAYDAIATNYCVDLNRIFAVGHSSGAQMITQLLCAGEDRFRAVSPVASSKYCNGWDAVAAIVIHGVDDIERGGQGEMRYGLNDGDGHIDFGIYHDSNECTEAATPFEPGGNCAANIDPGCVEYDDCAARTVFCNHNDPQYGTSNHGVPCFASPAMFDFFDDFR